MNKNTKSDILKTAIQTFDNKDKSNLIAIEYNTITYDFDICFYDEDVYSKESGIYQFVQNTKEKEIRITEWFEDFIERVNKLFNNDKFIIFIEELDNYEKNHIENIFQSNNIKDYYIKETEENKLKERYSKIENYIDFISKHDEPIILDKYNEHRAYLEDLSKNIVEIPVIATMSSGKSTLINALIGQNFLPALNQATTATTCRVIANSDKTEFDAKIFIDGDEKASVVGNDQIGTFIKDWNQKANEEDLEIILEGPIQTLQSFHFCPHIIDTPGPNNSQNERHRENTYNYLKDNQGLPIVLYIIDATDLSSNDDKNTLEEIRKVTDDNPKALERIIFVLNKVDQLDPEKEPISEVIRNSERYLEKFGIEKPKIFPVCSLYSHLAQSYINNKSQLTRKEKSDYENCFVKDFIPIPEENYLGYQLLENAPLTCDQIKYLEKKIHMENPDLDTHLIYSGMAALRLYIEDYILNQHTNRLYKEKAKRLKVLQSAILAELEYEKENFNKSIEEIKSELEIEKKQNIKAFAQLKQDIIDKISNEKPDCSFIDKEQERVNIKLEEIKKYSLHRTQIDRTDAEARIIEINDIINNLKMSIATTLESLCKDKLNNYFKKTKKLVLENYKTKIADSILQNSFNKTMLNSIVSINMDDIFDFTYEIEHKISKKERVKKRFLFIEWEKTIIRPDIFKVKRIDFYNFYITKIEPLLKEIRISIENYKNEYEKRISEIREEFLEIVSKKHEDKIKNLEVGNYKRYKIKKEEVEKSILFLEEVIKNFDEI